MKKFVHIDDISPRQVENDHGGSGPILFRRLLASPDFAAAIDFVDFTIIPAGTVIGRHEHIGNEEIYFIAAGSPLIQVDGEERRLERGSIAVVHSGQCHQLVNDTDSSV